MNENKNVNTETVEAEVKEDGKVKKFFKNNWKKFAIFGGVLAGVAGAFALGKASSGSNEDDGFDPLLLDNFEVDSTPAQIETVDAATVE